MDEEWDIIFSIIKDFASNNAFKGNNHSTGLLKKMFTTFRSLLLNSEFKGSKENLMNIFNEVKHIINDQSFDALYIHNLISYPAKYIEDKLLDIMDFTRILQMRDNDKEQIEDYDNRISEILNSFYGLYNDTTNIENKEALAKLFIQKSIEYSGLKMKINNSLKVLKILFEITQQTKNDEHFANVTSIFVKTIVRKDNLTNEFQRLSLATSRPIFKSKASLNPIMEYISLAKSAHELLFKLFAQCYLLYPPTRLIIVLNSMISCLETSIKEIKLLTLKFLANLSYDHNYLLFVSTWNAPSFLSGIDNESNTFPIQILVNAMTKFFNLDLDVDCILQALDVLISLCKSHYGLKNIDLSNFIEDLAKFGNKALQNKQADIGLKVVIALQLVALQKYGKNSEKPIAILAQTDITTCFMSCLNLLQIIVINFKGEFEEFKKSKQFKRAASMSSRGKMNH